MTGIPVTSWEQGAFITLFAVFVVAMMGAFFMFVRWILHWAVERDREWQKYMSGLRDQGAAARADDAAREERQHLEMVRAMEQMANAITTLTQRFDVHVTEEYARFDMLMGGTGGRRFSDHDPRKKAE